jgi:mRNA interferase MazF
VTDLPARGDVWWCEMPEIGRVESVSIAILVERLGRLADVRMRQICAALAIAVDCSD